MKIWQTGSGLELLPSICMTSKYSGHFRIINSKIMRSIGVWATLAFLVTVAAAQNCGETRSYSGDTVTPGPEIVTYGEPCFCKRSFPYAIQVPMSKPEVVESRKSYGYSVERPASASCASSLQLPIQIQTPVVQQEQFIDRLSGRSYGVTVQHQQQHYSPNYSFDVAIQRPVVPTKPVFETLKPLGYQIQRSEEKFTPQYAPLPIAIQTPVRSQKSTETRLVGLTSRVDRVLVPACECNDCPDCADVKHVC